jgi:hypothetical protein
VSGWVCVVESLQVEAVRVCMWRRCSGNRVWMEEKQEAKSGGRKKVRF